MNGGISNTTWQYFSPNHSNNHNNPYLKNIFSDGLQLKAGYQNKKWEVATGIGYLRTGYTFSNIHFQLYDNPVPYVWGQMDATHTIYDPHVIVPLNVGYKINLSHKLIFAPTIGVAALYNLKRSLVTSAPTLNGEETTDNFNTFCNRYGLMGMVQFNFEYRMNSRIMLTGGPSIQYMLTSETKDYSYALYAGGSQYDYAILMNIGLKYCFNHKHTEATPKEELKPAVPQTN